MVLLLMRIRQLICLCCLWPVFIFAQPGGQNDFTLRTLLTSDQLNHDILAVAGGFDSDGDGLGEFVTFSSRSGTLTETLRLFEATLDNVYAMQDEEGVSDLFSNVYTRGLAVANVDSDSDLEIVIAYGTSSSNARVRIFDITPVATVLTIAEHVNSPAPMPSQAPTGLGVLGDTDGDNNPEFVVGNFDDTNNIEIYEYTAPGYDTDESSGVLNLGGNPAALQIGDADNNGDSEIYYSAFNISGIGIRFIEHSGSSGSFQSADFASPVTILDGLTIDQTVTAFDYITGNTRMLDGDLFRDIVIGAELDAGLISNSEIYVLESNQEDTSLPVELSAFAAWIENDAVILEWTTQSEVNNAAFILEKRLTGQSFFPIAEIAGAGNSNTTQNYQFTDRLVQAGLQYEYRIADRDFSGNVTYYDQTISVYLETGDNETENPPAASGFRLYPNFPNPFNPTTTLQFEILHASTVTLTIHNVSGHLVKTLYKGSLASGKYERQWDGKNDSGNPLPSGVYVIYLRSGAFLSTHKMILLR